MAHIGHPKPAVVPDFILGGAQKSGTTTLFELLKQHPQIAATTPKEPHYFSMAPGAMSPEAYGACFPTAQPGVLRGEGSASYLAVQGTAERIKAACRPDVKLIFILRDPVERLWSGFLHMHKVRPLFDARDFDTAIAWQAPDFATLVAEEKRRTADACEKALLDLKAFDEFGSEAEWNFRYVQNTDYVEQLSRFYKLFPRDQIAVVLFEDVIAEPNGPLRALCRFLGVDDRFSFTPEPAHNDTRVPQETAVARVLANRGLRNRLRQVLPQSVFHFFRVTLKPLWAAPPPTIPAGAEEALRRLFATQMDALSQLTGHDLTAWRTRLPADV